MDDEHTAEEELGATLSLLQRAQGGHLEAYERLFERLYARVHAIVRARLGAHLRASMESGDVLHDALIQAIQSFDDFEVRDHATLVNWISRIVENRIRSAARNQQAVKRDRCREVPLQHILTAISDGTVHLEPATSSPGPSDVVGEGEQKSLVQDALDELVEEHRDVILHRHFAGATWEECARLLDRSSPDAARMLYGRAIVALRKVIRR